MPELDAFFASLGEVTADVPEQELLNDQAMIDAGTDARPVFELRAERAGLDLDVLQHEIAQLVESPVRVTLGRMLTGRDVVAEIRLLGRSCGVQFFLAGVLWEQQRHLPDLDEPSA